MEIHPALAGGCSKLCFHCLVTLYLQLEPWQNTVQKAAASLDQAANACSIKTPRWKGTIQIGRVFLPVGMLEALGGPGLSNSPIVLHAAQWLVPLPS